MLLIAPLQSFMRLRRETRHAFVNPMKLFSEANCVLSHHSGKLLQKGQGW